MANTTSNEPSGWVGWVYFASMMMLVLGGLQALSGLIALFKEDFYLVTQNHLVVFDYTTWGWVNLLMGIFLIAVGMALASGRTWARIVGSFLVVLSAITNLAFLPAYPVWSIIALVIDGLVLYALTVHGGELKDY